MSSTNKIRIKKKNKIKVICYTIMETVGNYDKIIERCKKAFKIWAQLFKASLTYELIIGQNVNCSSKYNIEITGNFAE